MAYNIAAWNVRGLNNIRKAAEVRKLIQSEQLALIGLVETKVKAKNTRMVQRRLGDWSGVTNNTKDPRGRIWVLWDPKAFKVTVVDMTDQVIHTRVDDLGARKHYMLSLVYARNNKKARSDLWKNLLNFSQGVASLNPWILMGDLNSCRFISEKVGGNKLHQRDVQELAECIERSGLEDIKGVGTFYTWTNRHEGDDRILSKLDRCLINNTWCITFPDVEGMFLEHGVSDHSPIILKWPHKGGDGHAPFRFFNHWLENKEFKALVEETWDCAVSGNPMMKLYTKLKLLKGKLKEWSKQNFSDLHEKVVKAREDLERIQREIQAHPLDIQLASMESSALEEYNKVAAAEESSLRQKSSASWALLGDENTSFFHKKMQGNRARNSVHSLVDSAQTTITDKREIAKLFVSYYQQVWGQRSNATIPSDFEEQLSFETTV
ncbi:Dnase i-like superfamily protein [Thalictrum thalictroides]|uniref:Dnase i-like superfamily protein n=1 Tax=Thalictrum thalictroides TaxID=46969 RepID=A0A7J6W6X2_THATH|nr:Dnase i-like superfamily protein [Thalictrum thalictroides]